MSSAYSVCHPVGVDAVRELSRGGVWHSTGGHPAHWHAEWQLVAVTRGDGWVRVCGSQHRTLEGSLFLVPPETVHSNDVFSEGCHFRSILIESTAFSEISRMAGLHLHRLRVSRDPVLYSPAMTRRFECFHQELENGTSDLASEEALTNWLIEILARLTQQNVEVGSTAIHPAAHRARDYLWACATENISLSNLAKEAGLSRYELSRQFKAAYGMPPHAWQLQARVVRAKEMLKSGLQVSEVAIDLGFSDQAHLSRVFRKSTGFTPAYYRDQFRNIIQDPVAVI